MSDTIIRQDDTVVHRFIERDFALDYWRQQPSTRVLPGGRGASLQIELDGEALVLRHYLRGGLMARLFTDRYLWSGLDNSRPMREWAAVRHAREHAVNVAPIVAVCIQRSGLFYRASLLSRYVANQGTLATLLAQSVLPANLWQSVGNAIRTMHGAGIDHADLNANNILLTKDEEICLIDFDKARIQQRQGAWCANNLARLRRSLEKITAMQRARNDAFHFSENDWQALLAGYRS